MSHEYQELSWAIKEAAELRRTGNEKIAEGVRRVEAAERMRTEQGERFSIVRTIHAMSAEGGAGLRSGYECEVAQEMARKAGRSHDPSRILLPASVLLGRTAIVGTAGAGGYLAANVDVGLGEALRGYSVAFDAGMSSLSGLRSNMSVAQESTAPSGGWIAEVGTQTASEPVFGAAALSPKHAVGFAEISKRLLTQAPGADAFLARALRRTIGQVVDTAVCLGTGTDEPIGLLNISDITVSTGTLTYAKLLDEEEAISNAFVSEANHKFIGSPDVRALLSERARGTGGGRFFWDDGKVLGKPAYSTPAAGTARVFHGDFSRVLFASWGPDVFELQVNPYQNFQAAIVGVRCVVSCDIALLNVNAVRVIDQIS